MATNSTLVTLQWCTSILPEDENSYYQLKYKRSGDTEWSQDYKILTSNQRSGDAEDLLTQYTAHRLSPNTSYKFNLVMVNELLGMKGDYVEMEACTST